jgi:hypothetical protein
MFLFIIEVGENTRKGAPGPIQGHRKTGTAARVNPAAMATTRAVWERRIKPECLPLVAGIRHPKKRRRPYLARCGEYVKMPPQLQEVIESGGSASSHVANNPSSGWPH